MNGNYAAIGIVVSVWLWAAQNATDGDLSDYAPEDIADAIGWKKPAGKLLDALVDTGFIDRAEDGSLTIHDWDEHAAMFQSSVEAQREKNRQRVQRYRERKRNGGNADVTPPCNKPVTSDVTGDVTLHTALQVAPVMPLPYQTIPDHTKPNHISGGVDASAPARTATAEELVLIGLTPAEAPPATTNYTVGRVLDATESLFRACGFGKPTAFDCRHVHGLTAMVYTPRGSDVDTNRLLLLKYAFEKAHDAGKPRDWNYVEGVMDRLAARDITTVQQAREWDYRRPDLYEEDDA